MNDIEKLEDEEIRMAMKEVIVGLAAHMQDAKTVQDIQNKLATVEEIDENFHRYSLIKAIKSSIESTFGPTIEKEIGNLTSKHGDQMISEDNIAIDQISDKLLQSHSYKRLLNDITVKMNNAGEYLNENFIEEFPPPPSLTSFRLKLDDDEDDDDINGEWMDGVRNLRMNERSRVHGERRGEALFSDCDSSYEEASSSHSTIMFLTNETLQEIALNLNKKNPLEIRRSALRSLLANTCVLDLPPIIWPSIRSELFDILIDFNQDLWIQALKIVSRGLTGSSISCSREMFHILVEILKDQFHSSRHDDDDDDDGDDDDENDEEDEDDPCSEGVVLDCYNVFINRLLRAFRLLNQYQRQLYDKHSEKNTTDVLKSTMSLLTLGRLKSTNRMVPVGMTSSLTPIRLLSLVDHKALWFTKAMHGCNTRMTMINLMMEDKSLLSKAVCSIMKYPNRRKLKLKKKIPTQVEKPKFTKNNSISSAPIFYDSTQLDLISAIHNIRLVGSVLRSRMGRDLFPVKMLLKTEDTVSLTDTVVHLIRLFAQTNQYSPPPSSSQSSSSSSSLLDPAVISYECVKCMCTGEDTCHECLCTDAVLEALMKCWVESYGVDGGEGGGGEVLNPNQVLQLHRSMDVISSLANTQAGRRYLISGGRSLKIGVKVHPNNDGGDGFGGEDEGGGGVSSPAEILAKLAHKVTPTVFTESLNNNNNNDNNHIVNENVVNICCCCCKLLQALHQLCCSDVGMDLIRRYDTHVIIKNLLGCVTREIDNQATPTPMKSDEGGGGANDSAIANQKDALLLAESDLIDNLLRLLATPTGVCLVLREGLMEDCITFMLNKYNKKLQVPRSERFGYGYAISQISTTQAGMDALLRTGFIKLLVQLLWVSLESEPPSPPPSSSSSPSPPPPPQPPFLLHYPPHHSHIPKPWPTNPIDKYNVKPFTNIVNVLSSYASLYASVAGGGGCGGGGGSGVKLDGGGVGDGELGGGGSGGGGGNDGVESGVNGYLTLPMSVTELMNRLLLFDDEKTKFLFNYDQTYSCGLRLLRILICCLDTMLLLQSKYDYQELLMTRQMLRMGEGVVDAQTTPAITIDDHTVQHNHILVRSFLLGGSTERVLPSINYYDKPIKMFHEYPVPECYWPKVHRHHAGPDSQQPQLPKLTKGQLSDESYQEYRDVIRHVIKKSDPGVGLKDGFVMAMLEQSIEHLCSVERTTNFTDVNVTDSAAKKFSFSKIQQEGVKLIIRYGTSLRLLTSSAKESTDKLKLLLAKLSMALRRNKDGSVDDHEAKFGFDWFSAVLFLLSNGNVNRTFKLCLKLATLHTSIYLWNYYFMAMIHNNNNNSNNNNNNNNSNNNNDNNNNDNINVNASTIQHVINSNIEIVLQHELPQILSTFVISGFAPAQICQHWIRQCFLNYLDWSQIQQSFICSLCLGADYLVYLCVSVLKHCEGVIKKQMIDRNLVIYLKEEPIRDFEIARYMDYMTSLEAKYRTNILRDMKCAYQQTFDSLN